MAHLGCWIPAESACVPIFDAIYTRIQTVESMELGLSAFMVDLNQMAHAITTATPRSLVLVDEFGKVHVIDILSYKSQSYNEKYQCPGLVEKLVASKFSTKSKFSTTSSLSSELSPRYAPLHR